MFRFLSSCLVVLLLLSCSQRKIKIGIQPYNEFDKVLIDTVVLSLQKAYNASILVLPERSLPKNSFVTIKSPRYRADSILIDLKHHMSGDMDYILGLTHSDISTTKRDRNGKVLSPESKYSDWGIFGLGYRPGPACVVSTYRLRNTEKTQFISRLKKVCIHELGHNLRLKHCETPSCVMQDAVEKISTVDSVTLNICDDCKRKIF